MKPIEIAILLFCAWSSSELLVSWQDSPLERKAWIALLLWSAPLLLYYTFPSLFPKREKPALLLLTLALCLTLLAIIGSLNTLAYFGLATALAALLPPSLHKIAWIALAIVWMPAFGWLASYTQSDQILPMRLLLAAGAGGWMAAALTRNAKESSSHE
jgi:hypothetical protein